MNTLELRLFGEPECTVEGRPWPLRGLRRAYEVLAICALQRGRPISREMLASHLWPDVDRDDARANLRRHLSRLPSLLPANVERLLIVDGNHVAWNEHSGALVDVIEFERCAEDAALHARALEWYRGDLLEPAYEDWLISHRERLRATAVNISQTLGGTALRNGDFVAAREFAQRALDLGDWREDSLRLVMTALYALGDRTGALCAYDRFVETLAREMHVSAMPETIALRDAIVADLPIPQTVPEISTGTTFGESYPFVGRERELTQLSAAWDRAKRHAGGTVFIGGEAGIGKSRLAHALARTASDENARVLWGYAPPDGSSAYGPLADVVRAALPMLVAGDVDDVWLGSLADLVPEVTRVRPGIETPSVDGSPNAERLHEAFVRIIEATSRRRPTLVILEDLHWADADTLEAVAYIARRIRGSSVLLMLTHRSEETPLSHPLRTVRRRLLAEHRASMLALVPIGEDAVRELAAHVLQQSVDHGAIAAEAIEATHGNPLFVLQFLRNHLERTDEGSTSDSNVAALIDSRLSRLPNDARTLFHLGSLIDTRFTIEELAAVSGSDEADVQSAVDVLLDRQYVRWWSQPGFTLTFSHQLLRESALRQIPPSGRAPVHRRIARILETTRTPDDRTTLLVARHYDLGGERAQAYARYLSVARSNSAYAPLFTLETAHSALRVAQTGPERFDALRVALSAHQTVGADTAQYRADADEIVETASALGEPEQFQALLERTRYLNRAAAPELERSCNELLKLARKSGDAGRLSQAYEELGNRLLIAGKVPDAIAACEMALEYAERGSLREFRLRASLVSTYIGSGDSARGLALFSELERVVDSFEDARAHLALGMAHQVIAVVLDKNEHFEPAGKRLIGAADRVGALRARWLGMSLLSHGAYRRGDVAAGRDYAEQTRASMKEHHIVQTRLIIEINLTHYECELGNLDAAIDAWKACFTEAKAIGLMSGTIGSCVRIAEALIDRGNTDEALAWAKQGVEIVAQSGEPRFYADAQLAYGRALFATGSLDDGLEAIRDAVRTRGPIGANRFLSHDLTVLIESLLACDLNEEAAAYADRLRALYERGRDQVALPARICLVLSDVAAATGDDAAARRYGFEGEVIVRQMLERIPDEETSMNYAALPYNRRLLDQSLVAR